MAVSKIALATGEVLIDLTNDSVTAETLAAGVTAHGANGEPIVGTMRSSEDLDTVLAEQELLITELQKTLRGKAAGGDSDAIALLNAIIDRTATSVSSNATKLGDYAFRNCTRMVTANFPNATSIGQHAFKYCNALKNVYVPNATVLSASSFEDCGIKIIDLPKATTIQNSSFNGSQLGTLIIRTTSKVCTLANKNAFADTPIEVGTGFIYVPAPLLSAYQAASNWSTYAAQIRAIEDYPEITGG